MVRVFLMFLLAILVPSVARAASDMSCVTTFYQSKDMGCIDVVIKGLPNAGITSAGQKSAINPDLLGFFAEVFSEYPQEKSRILDMDVPIKTKAFFAEALYEAGFLSEAQTYATANGFSSVVQGLQSHNTATIKQMKPNSDPVENDLLIGAYMASGNTEYIERVLANFSDADDGMVGDSIRLSLMQGKFGPTLTPPGREQTMIVKTACQKYECKKDPHALMRVMTLSSAYWATNSLAQQDAAIKKTRDAFFENDPRLKQLVFIEENAFGNYLTTLAAYAAIKDNPNVNASLATYEKLGSAKEAADAMMMKK